MGLASSSAVRRDEAYGSLGAFGGMGGGRALKKKPVLVLDPEELAKAHQLFQLGAAEQIGEFDPKARVSRSAAEVFGSARVVPIFDEEDDYVAPLALADVEEEEAEEDLPPIDLDAIMSLSHAEDEAEQAAFEAAGDDWDDIAGEPQGALYEPVDAEDEPAASLLPDPPPALSPADALARIILRAAPQSPAEPAPQAQEPVLPPADESIAVPPEAATTFEQPAAFKDESIAPEPVPNPSAQDDWFHEGVAETEPFELVAEATFASEDTVDTPAPQGEAPHITHVIGEEGTRSALRARLVREDLTIARPEPSAWRKLVIAVRRWWQRS